MSTILDDMHDLGWKARYNVRCDYPQVKFPDLEWLAIGGRDPESYFALSRFTESRAFPTIRSESALWRGLYAATRAEGHLHYDPFKLWLDSLPDWDGEKRLGKLLKILFGTSEEKARSASYYMCVAPIVRAYQPGARILKIPVLISWTGWHSCDILITELPPACVSESSHIQARESSEYEFWAIFRGALLECPVRDMTDSKAAKLFRFLFRTEDNVRLPYRQRQSYPRRAAFVLSGSDSKVPRGIVGNDAYIPIAVAEDNYHSIGDYLEEHRQQLWAEALAIYRSGDHRRFCPGYFDA